MKQNPFLLNRDIEPVLYSIELEPNLKEFTFKGTETIKIRALKPFSKIELHALELNVKRAFLYRGEVDHPSGFYAQKISTNEKRETVTLDFGETVKPGQYPNLFIEFEGILNDKMHGFYRTSYEVDGQKRWGAATQFEATDARRCFPSWDEPDRKAKFQVTLNVPRELTALSNMPVLEEVSFASANTKKIIYDTTPVMSTYLLCFVIADLEYVEGYDSDGILIRIYTTPGKREQGKFALEVTQHTLPYFSKWFGIPYVLPKCDMVALPDFASGAMENWGLVTYRETALLVDPVNSSAAARQRVAEVIDHELAHQWFGNLVTMKWWTDLWLNEGFASYMGPKAVAHQFPEWKVWNQYVANEYLGALHADSLKNTHPIEIEVENPYEIREIFDSITYLKGSVVNRMLEHYLGEDLFRRGLALYLRRFAYSNARTEDLWNALEEVSGKPVKAIMNSYTKQPGYPILDVEPASKNGKTTLSLEQKRFIFDGSQDRSKLSWKVPIQIAAHGRKAHHEHFVAKQRETVTMPNHSGSAWMKLNPGHSGFYRVEYPTEMLARLATGIRSGKFSAIDCMGLIDDVFAQARAGNIRTSKALELIDSAKNEDDYNVWLGLSSALGGVEHIFLKKPEARFSAFARNLFTPLGRKMGWNVKPKDTHLDVLLRSLALANLGHYGDKAVIAEAKKRFETFVRTGKLDPNLRGVVYSLAARYGGSSEFTKLTELYRKSTLQEERVRILRALTRFRDTSVIRKVLEFALSSDVRSQDTFVILAGFGGNSAGREIAWRFVKQNWKSLEERYTGGGQSLLGRILEGATTGFSDAASLADVRKFFKQHPVPGTERTMRQALEIIQSNISWSRRDAKDVEQWFAGKRI